MLPEFTVIAVAVILGIRLFTFISDYSVTNVLFQHGPHREGD
jgi:hypothetical protein